MSAPSSYTGFVDNGGIKIHFRAAGKGPVMILQHGFPDNEEAFSEQVKHFSGEYTVICPTLRGYPPSDIPEKEDWYEITLVATDIAAVLDHFKCDKAFVGGHDFGGVAIQTFALLHPERVAGLIIINSPILPTFYKLVDSDEEQQRLSHYTRQYIEYQPGDSKNEEYIVRTIRDPERRAELQAYLVRSPVHGMFNYYKKNYPGSPYGAAVETSAMLYSVPTLIIWGLEDEYFSLKILDGLGEIFLAPFRLVSIPGAGHWSFQDQPTLVNREISSWLETLKLQ